jgi:hypothetical protein
MAKPTHVLLLFVLRNSVGRATNSVGNLIALNVDRFPIGTQNLRFGFCRSFSTKLAVLSLGWNAISWDADSFKPKIDYSSTGTVIMSSEMRELIKMSYPNLKEDEGRLLHAYLIKRVLGYSPFTWPGPNDKFGEFGEDIKLICEVLERVWLRAANESSDILPGLTNENEVGDLKLAFEDPLDDNDDDDNGRRLYFLDHFYSEIVDKILFKAGASRRPLRLSAQNEEHLYNWARSTVTTVIREVQDVVHVAAQDLDEAEAAIVDRLKGDRVHETTRKGTTVQILGLRHEEQRNALQSVARDQKNIHSLMLLDDRDYLVWMAGGAVFRVPSLQINSMFTAVRSAKRVAEKGAVWKFGQSSMFNLSSISAPPL